MAITQTRMLALIKAADDFREKLLFAEKFIQQTFAEIPRNPTLDEALSAIHTVQHFLAQLAISPQHLDTIATERAHFTANASRNARHALRARIKRNQSDSFNPARSTAPDNIGAKTARTFDQHLKPKGATLRFHDIPAEFTQTQKPVEPPKVLSDKQLAQYGDMDLAGHKLEINKFYESLKQPAPYPDYYDDSIPLAPEHKRHLQIPVDEDDSLF